MKYLILTLSLLPLLASCEMDNDFYEPAPPRVQVERNNYHQHESRGGLYYRDTAPEQRYVEERSFIRPSAPRPVSQIETANHRHQYRAAAPAVRRFEIAKNVHGHPAAVRPGTSINTVKNTHGHPGHAGAAVTKKKHAVKTEEKIEVQKNVHGHD